jgi:putative spermidine/putrescine transport system substrate-binding protein
MRTQYWLSACVAIVATSVAAGGAIADDAVNVVSWGGSYTQSQIEAMYKPFTAKTGIQVHSIDYSGGLAEIKAQEETKNVTWDAVDLWASDAVLGCTEGYLEKIDKAKLPSAPDGTSAAKDFMPGTILECGVGQVVGSTVFAYDKSQFKGGPEPATLMDFFDVKKFPQKRCLQKTPQNNLEWALMADGVAPQDVYKVLATKEGVDRAFKKLDTIKPFISVWWTAGSQPPDLLASGDVAMTSSFNSRITNAILENKKPFGLIWDHGMWSYDVWSIPKGAPHPEQAMQFVAFATSTVPLAGIAGITVNGSPRASSLAYVSKYTKPGVDATPYLPTAPNNLKVQVQFNVGFWVDHGDELNEKFASWLAK